MRLILEYCILESEQRLGVTNCHQTFVFQNHYQCLYDIALVYLGWSVNCFQQSLNLRLYS